MQGTGRRYRIGSSVFVWIAAGLWIAAASPVLAVPYLDVVVSELMYHAPGTDEEGECLELTNRGTQTANLTGWRLNDGVRYSFPPGTTLAAGQRLVVAHDPAAAEALYGISGVLGPYDGRLANDGERIELLDANDGLVCEVDYDDESPWPTGGDGDGRSIELTDLSRNHNVGRFWSPSSRLLGTPGAANAPGDRPVTVVINEFVANSSGKDWIELYNYGSSAVDLNGYYLTDNPKYPTKARISASWSAGTTIIPAKGYWTSDEDDWATFKLSSTGEQVHLVAADGVTWVDGCDFGVQPLTDVSEGRYPDADATWVKLATTTRGSANVPPPASSVVINEIMYHPAGDSVTEVGTEYLELYNRGGSAVDLTGWTLNRGIDYAFPAGTSIPAGGYLVVASVPTLVEPTYGITGVLGPYDGKLSNFSDEVEIEDALGNRVDFVEYRQEGLWPTAPDGTGPSLELANYNMDNRLPGAWRASTGNGTPKAANSQSVANPAASIDRVAHTPLVPTSSQSVIVTALVGAGNLTSVRLYYKRDADGSFTNTTMYDDGAHGDGLTGDGVYGATIPAYPVDGTIIEFYVQANATGGNRTYPDAAAANKSCLYIVQNSPTSPMAQSNLTIFRFLLTDENWSWLLAHSTGETPTDCTFIYGDRAYYNCGVRFRGGSRGGPKYSYKVDLTPGYHFRGAAAFDLNFEKNDATCLKPHIMIDMVNDMGLPGAKAEFIHTRWRNTYGGMHYYTEDHAGGDYLENHLPGDSEGNLYKAIAPWTTATAWNEGHYTGSSVYEKQSNQALDDWSDFIAMGGIMVNEPDATYESETRRVADVVNWGRSFAMLGVGCLIDTPWHFHNQNYRLYRRFSDNRFVHVLHDFDDAYWSTMYSSAGPNASSFPDVNRFLNWTSFKREQYHGLWRALNLTDGVYRDEKIKTKVRYYYGLIYNDVDADSFSGSGDRWNQFVNAISSWDNWIVTRNSLLRDYLPSATLAITTNGGNPIVTSSPNLTLAGTAPISAPRLEVGGSTSSITWSSSLTNWSRAFVLVYQHNTIVARTLDDAGNEIQRDSIEVTYTNGLPDGPAFTANVTSGPPPLTVQFTDQSTVPNPTAWFWEFGDGQTSDQRHPSHQYAMEGAFTVRLTVTGDNGPETVEKADYITVAELPKVAFIVGPVPPTTSDAAIVTHVRSKNLAVDVYDDEPANRPSAAQIAATHDLVLASSTVLSANVAGEFRNQAVPFIYWESSLSLSNRESLADGAGTISNKTQIRVIDNSHPVMNGIPLGVITVTSSGADFSRSKTPPIAPGARVLARHTDDATQQVVIVAEPGAQLLDGGVAASRRGFLYLYDATWPATTATGKQIFDNAVAWGLGPADAQFSASITNGPAPLRVTFTDQSTGPVTSWTWTFGDSTGSRLRYPTHVYAQPGTYDVSLTAAGSITGPDTLVRTGYIVVGPPHPADFDIDGDVDADDLVILEGCATGPDIPLTDPTCIDQGVDLEGDDDVDQSDFGLLQRCFSGEDVPGNTSCLD